MKFVFKAKLKIKEDKKNEGFYVIELDEIGRKAAGGLKKPVK